MAAEPYVLERDRVGLFGHVRGLTPAMSGFAIVAGVAAAGGGYFPTTWGWTALVLLAIAAGALAARGRVALSRGDVLFLGALTSVVGWIALSVLWSRSVPATVLEVERSLMYLAAALAVLLVARRESAGLLVGGVLSGISAVAAYAVGTRLYPERLGSFDPVAGYRLAAPVGYWNGLGLICSMGALLALGLATRHGHRQGRAAAAAALPLLVTACFFTFSRGAWAAFAVGLVAMLALGTGRLRLVATGAALVPASAAAVFLASRAHALTHEGATLATASREGHRLAPALALLTLASALSLLGVAALQRRVRIGARGRRVAGVALLVIALGALAAGLALRGGPAAVAHKAYSGFTAKAANDGNLNRRVLSLSSNGRVALWSAAWQDAETHPLLGSGAGTYEQFFYEHRTTAWLNVRDAHNLYLETLAELGPPGLVLLLVALAVPLAAAVRGRRDGITIAAAGAYTAFLAHAAWDWDWELPAVTLTALLAASVLLVRARENSVRPLSGRIRIALAAALVVPAAFAAVAALGNRATAAAQHAAEAGNWSRAAEQARIAARLAPWSSDPARASAQAKLADGDFAGAAAALRAAIAKDPRNWALWLDLAIATDGAQHVQALDRARALNPLDPVFPTS